jgi:hypothetical protein
MFSSFSWTNYFLLIGIVLVVYAMIILFLYYRKEMNKFFFSRRNALQEMIDMPVARGNDPMRMVHELVSELGQLIRRAAEDKTIEAELVFGMQQAIKNYLILRPTEFNGKINQYIKDEMEICGLLPLTNEQMEFLWND